MTKRLGRRDFLRIATAGATAATATRFIKSAAASENPADGPRQWAMVIDQSKCIGCGYCTQACQARNDINPDIQWNYGEVVYAVLVPPLVRDGRLPKGAFFPWQVATTTRAAREHAIERWRLPHWMEDVEIEFDRQPGRTTARVRADGQPALEMTITEHQWAPVSHLYQSFQKDDSGTYLANILFEGEKTEHQEETGRIVLHDNAFNEDLVRSEVFETPFQELSMRRGCQLFDPLAKLQG